LPWAEAIAEYKARGVVSERELSTLMRDYAQRSDAARKLMLAQIQDFVRSQVVTALEQGTTFPEFAKTIRDGGTSLGITAADPAYLNLVFRTSVQSAYGAGRYRAMTDPALADERPFVQYRTTGDARVRASHAALDGPRHNTCYRTSDPLWHRISPPNGFQCRCSCVMLTADEASGMEVLGELPSGYVAEDGFDGPPVARLTM
jgi:SPP1 gp7 family putative phage head morphogenesis protein